MAWHSLGIVAFGGFFAIVETLHAFNTSNNGETGKIPPDVPVPVYIPGTWVVMSPDYDDYKRGHQVLQLYPEGSKMPGRRIYHSRASPKLPAFDPRHPEKYPETFVNSSHNDPLRKCAPDGQDKGHYMYNVWTPELVVYSLGSRWDLPFSGRTDAAVIISPGGGDLHLDWDTEGISPAEWLNSLGITAFVLKYRVPDRLHNLLAADGQRALSLVRHMAPKYGINRSRIGFWGSSVGALQATKICRAKKRVYQAMDVIDEQPWNIDFMIMLYPMVPSSYFPSVDPHFPPTVVGYTADDPCCDALATDNFIFNVYTKFRRSPNMPPSQNIFHKYARGGHGWSDCYYYPYMLEIGAKVCEFKSTFVKPFLEKLLGRELPRSNEEERLMPAQATLENDAGQEVGSESLDINVV